MPRSVCGGRWRQGRKMQSAARSTRHHRRQQEREKILAEACTTLPAQLQSQLAKWACTPCSEKSVPQITLLPHPSTLGESWR
mmetsp:Transcript_3484/g.5367  ORF Transcript_3484/g.5367 Transcript_3484/m.5367 type:complete len:82 (+) Transcript_3484:35-280(+)